MSMETQEPPMPPPVRPKNFPPPPSPVSKSKTLSDKHRAELRESGIGEEMIAAAAVWTGNGEVRDLLGWAPPGTNGWGESLVLPYFDADGKPADYHQVKPEFPRLRSGRPVKYESPEGRESRAYFPPNWLELSKSSRPWIITEGAKKCLSAADRGFPSIAIAGVWNWCLSRPKSKGGKGYGEFRLLPELDQLDWSGRDVLLCFDSDAVEKRIVRLAEARLAETLQKKGAAVRIIRLPASGDSKVGLDDFIAARGESATQDLQALIDAAQPAETPPTPDPMEWARMFIEDQFTTPRGLTLRWWRDEFHAYDGYRYRPVPASEMKAILLQWLDKRTKAIPKLANDVISCLGSEVRVPFDIEQPALLGPNGATKPDWIVVSNGILDVPTMLGSDLAIIRPHTPSLFTPTALPFPFRREALCPVWFETLNQIFDGDDECFQLLAEWFGYNLVDDTSHQCIMMLEGPPRTGKGTVLRTLRHVVGSDNCVSPRFATMGETFGLMGLVGKRVALCPDAHLGHGEKATAVMELLKLISGEDAVEIHRKNLPPITTRLRIKFTLAVNELPKFGDNAGAMATRLLILPFRRSFLGKEDRGLEDKIVAEAEGILTWAFWGLKRLRANGRFTKPATSQQIEADFERLSSPVKAFLQDCCVIGPATVSKDALWKRWCDWCTANGHLAGSRDVFGGRLRALVPGLKRSQPRDENGVQQNLYAGLGLTQ